MGDSSPKEFGVFYISRCEIMFLFYVFCQRCPQTQPTGFYNTVGLNDDDLTKSYKSHSCTCEIVLDKLVKLRKQKTSE